MHDVAGSPVPESIRHAGIDPVIGGWEESVEGLRERGGGREGGVRGRERGRWKRMESTIKGRGGEKDVWRGTYRTLFVNKVESSNTALMYGS